MNEVLTHRCALVTGASSGLGAEFARQLAPRCRTLALVARRADRLKELADELCGRFPELDVLVFPADLSDEAQRQSLVRRLREEAVHPDLLVNNAGLGDYGEFTDASWPRIEAMLRLNVEALTYLTRQLVPDMMAGGGGAVLNVSSLASLLPIPDFAVYAASKAYVTSFSEALRMELREHGIRVTALCPGPVHTEFGAVAMRDRERSELPGRELFYVDAPKVVAEALAGLAAGRPRVYPGWQVAAGAAVISLLPLAVIRVLMGRRPRRG